MRSGIGTACLMGLCLAATAWPASPGRAATEEDFLVKTTGNLIDLCSAPREDPLYTAAVNFCEGFMVGAYRYHVASVQAEGGKPLVCPPNPPPSRDESVARFIAWSRAHPEAMNTTPVEGLFEFLSQSFPCRG